MLLEAAADKLIIEMNTNKPIKMNFEFDLLIVLITTNYFSPFFYVFIITISKIFICI